MTSERHQRLKDLFQRAEALPSEERQQFLIDACPDDSLLRAEVEELLATVADTPDSFLEPVESAGPAPSKATLDAGRVLLHYRVQSVLGQGGMGEVYCALDTKLDREVALKVLPPDLATDPERLDRFKREAKALAALDHSGIVTIHSVDESEGIHFLTMGLVKGRTLAELIPEEGLPIGELCDIALPLTEAVGTAHRKGITHRDLKPGNVMVTDEGGVKVLDFGLAKSAQVEEDGGGELPTEALTAEGRILGTVTYMSPEQAEGKPVGSQSDVFSLGILLYEMTTGQRPFQGDTTLGTLSAVLQANPKPVVELRPAVSPELAAIIERCLERQPAARYRDATELHKDLANLQDPVTSSISGVADRDPPAKQSRRVVFFWLAAIAIVILALATLWSFRDTTESGSAEVPAEAEPSTSMERPMIAVLPFQNLGSSQDEYFAIGMTEEIASRMAPVRSIGVIATSSTRQYADTQKTAQEIGEDLGAEYLVTGSVLWARSEDGSSKIRITPQLVSTADGTQIWAQSYDRVLDDIFAIQTEIASQVVRRLGVSLADPERAAVGQFPTDNLEAYDTYLRAMAVPVDIFVPSSGLPRIEGLYRAVELDPNFALAWFQLTSDNSLLYTFNYDTSEERRQLTLEAARKVEETAPGSALAATAMGHYQYRIERNYDKALEEVSRAIELDPNNGTALWIHGSVLRRQAEFEAAAESYQSAIDLDPRNAFYITQLGIVHQYLRRYEEAVDKYDQAIALNEGALTAHHGKMTTYWSWAGHRSAARQTIEAFPMQRSPVLEDYLWFWQTVYEGDFRAALDRIQTTREEWLGMPIYYRPRELLEGLALLGIDERDKAEEQFELALAKLQTSLSEVSDNEKMLSSLGVTLAALGRPEEAIDAALRATEIVPLATNPWFAQAHIVDLAWTHTLTGDYDSALEQLELLLERPSRVTISFLKLDPRWAPLLDQPRFKELEERFG